MLPSRPAADLFGEPVLVPDHPLAPIQPSGRMCLQWEIHNDGGCRILTVGTEKDCWTLTVDFAAGTLTWDRSGLEIPVDVSYGVVRTCSFLPCEQMKLLIYIDNSFVEIYAQNGERVMSGRCYPGAARG